MFYPYNTTGVTNHQKEEDYENEEVKILRPYTNDSRKVVKTDTYIYMIFLQADI